MLSGTQRIIKVRRDYNRWVADETLEDYALRFTPRSFRKWSEARVANTALGAVSFLALEAIGGALTLQYGFTNALWAIGVVSVLIFLTGLPISYHAARYGVDMDLLTRGAGFGYLGSTVTSLIYAVFTFLFFALEAAIMSSALQLYFGMPIAVAYLVSALVIIPLVTFGITLINRLQQWTQPLWLLLLIVPFVAVAWREPAALPGLIAFTGKAPHGGAFDLHAFGSASAVVLALIVQIGEQVDFLRFLPPKTAVNRKAWWLAMLSAGPGWIVPGALKMLGGALLAVLALRHGVSAAHAGEPTQMYLAAYRDVFASPALALAATVLLVVVSQVKINVTNAYAGSLAWSNFFARLTHSHPGRVVWLVFNVLIALLLSEMGVFDALGKVLALYANLALVWIGALVGDLAISKPLGYSPAHIEFKRAHLFDANPVGPGAMLVGGALALLAHGGLLGSTAEALSPFVALGSAFVAAPMLARLTRGRFYIARGSPQLGSAPVLRCVICENDFEREDMAHCPAYGGTICSLCCSLDARCGDACKPHARLAAQAASCMRMLCADLALAPSTRRIAYYLCVLAFVLSLLGGVLYLVYRQSIATLGGAPPAMLETLADGYLKAFFALTLVSCIGVWGLVLARESRKVTQEESSRQTILLMQEIEAHGKTDAMLQHATEAAESANRAKSRYVTGLSHELRTPLNSILGYTQLLMHDRLLPETARDALAIVHRSGEHLLALVDGLLDIARIEAGKLQLDVDEIALPAFLTQLAAMLEPQAADKGLRFELVANGRLPAVVRADEKRVRQILINLLGNAVRFTSSGAVTMRVSYAWEIATFEVMDTGAGIPIDQLERLFMPFERGMHSDASDNGAGLGLTICRMLTTLMGGELSVTSTVGVGTAVVLRLFLPQIHTPRAPSGRTHGIVGYAGARRTILVVDDLAEQRRIVRGALTPLGFEVAEAGSGPEALRWLGTARADLIVMDVSMPAMDGFESSRLIRRNRLSDSPILILSANAFAADREKGAASGCDDYLAKPMRIPQLLDKLETLLGLHWLTDAPAKTLPQPGAASHAAPPERLPAPLVGELRNLLAYGYVEGIVQLVDRTLDATPALAATLAPLRIAARRFRLAELGRLLDEA